MKSKNTMAHTAAGVALVIATQFSAVSHAMIERVSHRVSIGLVITALRAHRRHPDELRAR